jgi:hypothetical protein
MRSMADDGSGSATEKPRDRGTEEPAVLTARLCYGNTTSAMSENFRKT